MAALPRIVTVDPSGKIAQIVRAAVHLLEGYLILIDAPTGDEAIEEVKRGGVNLVIASWELDDGMKGWQLAAGVRKASDNTPLLILGTEDDPDVDEETQQNENAPFVYMRRPMDTQRFLRVLNAALTGTSVQESLDATSSAGPSGGFVGLDMGPIPSLDLNAAQSVLNSLLTDLGAMAILLTARDGNILLEFGASGYFNKDALAKSLIPTVTAQLNILDLVGGNATGLIFYDGDNFDVFVLSVGLHHMLIVVFEGERGRNQFGAVNRYGRRASEDLIALIPGAYTIQEAKAIRPERKTIIEEPVEEDHITLESAGFDFFEEEEPTPAAPKMDAIPDEQFNLDDIFGASEAADVSWDMEALENIAKETDKGDKVDFDQASRLGILKN